MADALSKQRPRAFTLTELMISVAISLLLIIGISQVFTLSSQTIGSGQAVAAFSRSSRATQRTMFQDLKQVSQASPFMVLESRRQAAFLNQLDVSADADYDVTSNADQEDRVLTVDIDGDGVEEPTPYAVYNRRNHRVDTFGFFAQGRFRAQKGKGPTPLIPDLTGPDAFIHYSHLRFPGQSGTMYDPGEGRAAANSRNFYASDWVLGRTELLLTASPGNEVAFNVSPDSASAPPSGSVLLGRGSRSNHSEADGQLSRIQQSRYSIVNTTLKRLSDDLRRDITARRASVATSDDEWYDPLIYRFEARKFITRPIDARSAALTAPLMIDGCSQFVVEYAGDFVTQVRDVMTWKTDSTWQSNFPDGQFGPDGQVTPHDIQHPLYGHVISAEPDGITDFVVVTTAEQVSFGTQTVRRRVERIRFYGMPRDTTSATTNSQFDGEASPDGEIRSCDAAHTTTNNDLVDVVPLRDVIRSGAATAAAYVSPPNPYRAVPFPPSVTMAPQQQMNAFQNNAQRAALAASNGATFERLINYHAASPATEPAVGSSWLPFADGGYYLRTSPARENNLGARARYICAWGPGEARPSLFRLTVTYEDRANRRTDGETHQYVVQPGW